MNVENTLVTPAKPVLWCVPHNLHVRWEDAHCCAIGGMGTGRIDCDIQTRFMFDPDDAPRKWWCDEDWAYFDSAPVECTEAYYAEDHEGCGWVRFVKEDN